MLSNPLQRFSPYNNLPTSPHSLNISGSNNTTRPNTRSNGFSSLRHTYRYTVPEPQQYPSLQTQHTPRSGQKPKQRQLLDSSAKSTNNSNRVRRRISRACDQCNQLRTKCDGKHPCAHCVEFGLGCEYAREKKKRGKASRKDIAAQKAAAQAAAESAAQTRSHSSQSPEDAAGQLSIEPQLDTPSTAVVERAHQLYSGQDGNKDNSFSHNTDSALPQEANNISELGSMSDHIPLDAQVSSYRSQMNNPEIFELNEYSSLPTGYERSQIAGSVMHSAQYEPGRVVMDNCADIPYGMQIRNSNNYNENNNFRLANSPLEGYAMMGDVSPSWGISLPSPSGMFQPQAIPIPLTRPSGLRYPVLDPLVPHLGNIMPLNLACDLLELYFSSSSSAQMHPMSPYILGFIFRKRAFLHPTKPRKCQPALLASMLWVAAQTSEASFLSNSSSTRSKVCHNLLDLTVGLLKPLIHTPPKPTSPGASPNVGAVALGGLGVAMPGSINLDALSGEGGAIGATGTLDDVATYIHLATVVSASEYKGASIRWWNAAWSLARELKLGRELPENDINTVMNSGDAEDGVDEHDRCRNAGDFVTEEEREERRRVWWLVYIVDRHLALCYNRPLFLMDVECSDLLQPIDETVWQRGDFPSSPFRSVNGNGSVLTSFPDLHDAERGATRGPGFECRGHSIFGYFLPLMTILGEIIDLHHAKNHPRFGKSFRPAHEWDNWVSEITRHLEIYETSLKEFERHHLSKMADEPRGDMGHRNGAEPQHVSGDAGTPSTHSARTNTSNRMTESDIQAHIVLAYGTHVMHVLHVLLAGRWDPINLIDDNDLWISSPGFVSTTNHAVAAAEAISQMLEYDPGLEYMPFFFGIYLLQGSFLLLLIADKLQFEASPSVVRACETIVRAHEASVVTLNTEYQRNFSKIMRSALAVVRGRVPEDIAEQKQRKRELLGLYRWAGDGTGLAL